MNVFTFTGNIGKDAEQDSSNSFGFVRFSAAAASGYGDKKKTTWVRCTMNGKRGEAVLPYLKKGARVCVSGELTVSEWDDKDGNKRHSVDLFVDHLTLLGNNDKRQSESRVAEKFSDSTGKAHAGLGDFEDDIPF